MQHKWLRVALDVPLDELFDYRLPDGMQVQIGQRVLVPFGRRRLVGMVVATGDAPVYHDESAIKPIDAVFDDLPPMPEAWLDFARFAADYYQRPLGEVVMPALPAPLRTPSAYTGKNAAGGPVQRLLRRQARQAKASQGATSVGADSQVAQNEDAVDGAEAEQSKGTTSAASDATAATTAKAATTVGPTLSAEQQQAVQHITQLNGYRTVLLHGVTGSGKTEVYLRCAAQVLAQGKQVMMLVPEINLSPQFERRLRHRFGDQPVAVLHSGLSNGERLAAWVAIQQGQAKLILGTRLAIFAPVQDLGLIVVDEEHAPSYKQQDGLRYSARDLAIWRGHQLGIPVVLGSATPSLETWHHAQEGKYDYCALTQRVAEHGFQPRIELIDTQRLPLHDGISEPVLELIAEYLNRQQQVLVFINRRGYAPVLECGACGWRSECRRCSAYMVLHRESNAGRAPYRLQCHHCGLSLRPPRRCPECGNQDIQPLGRGTQRVEECLAQHFPDAVIQRIDADSARGKGQAEALFDKVHDGTVDILVGTQMVSKGHDFKRLNLVCVLNADSGLYAQDFRAPERLFAQLMQVAGRAGRHLPDGRVVIQTQAADHPLYHALQQHDFEVFAESQLMERRVAALPPFSFHVLVSATGKNLSQCMAFLEEIKGLVDVGQGIRCYDPVPLRIVRVMYTERAQLLVEASARPRLQQFLPHWVAQFPDLAKKHRINYVVEVDPLEI